MHRSVADCSRGLSFYNSQAQKAPPEIDLDDSAICEFGDRSRRKAVLEIDNQYYSIANMTQFMEFRAAAFLAIAVGRLNTFLDESSGLWLGGKIDGRVLPCILKMNIDTEGHEVRVFQGAKIYLVLV